MAGFELPADPALDAALAGLSSPAPSAETDARLVAGIEALGAPTALPAARDSLPWVWVGVLAGLLLIAVSADLRRPFKNTIRSEGDSWSYRPPAPLSSRERPYDAFAPAPGLADLVDYSTGDTCHP